MKKELANVQRERQQLEQQRKLLACTGPCASCPCTPPVQNQSSQPTIQLFKASPSINRDLPGPMKVFFQYVFKNDNFFHVIFAVVIKLFVCSIY